MTTLYSSVIRLHVLHDGVIPQTQGRFALSAFLDIVERVDPILSQVLHDAPNSKPFTVSQLRGLPVAREGEIRVRAGHECYLRVTLAGEDLFTAFIQRFLYGTARPTIRLGHTEFGVSEVATAPGSHLWSGYTTSEALLNEARTEDTIGLEFASPFSFSLGDNRAEIMPRAELIFGGLQRKWVQWCAAQLPAQIDREWLRENVLVSDWRMHSRMLRYGSQAQIGSEGTMIFQVFAHAPDVLRTLNALADFAFFAGVGRKTTQGMGQVRRNDRWTPPREDEVEIEEEKQREEA
jgi:CRISPR-associated endoribonuclease Cas6